MKLDHLTHEEKKAHRKAQLARAMKRYREKHSEKLKAEKKARAQTEAHKSWRKEYQSRPEVALKERERQRLSKHKNRAASAKWQRERRAKSPMRVVTHRMSALVGYHLKARKAGKSWKAMVSYTPEELMVHLERQFSRGMTWENIGEWQIDHILPVSSFSYENESDPEFQRCWGLPNLRPLWRLDNIKKNAKRTLLL